MQYLTIKEEFKNLIPKLGQEELAELERNILDFGVRDKLVTWQGILIDGHNRYAICQKHNIEFQTVEMQFEDENAVKEWILRNQLGRRNLTDIDRIKVAMQLKKSIEARAKTNQGARNDILPNLTKCEKSPFVPNSINDDHLTSVPNGTNVDTLNEIAKLSGVGRGTVARFQAVERTAPEPIKQAMDNKVISINKAYELNKSLIPTPEPLRRQEAEKLLQEEQDKEFKRIDEAHKIYRKISDMSGNILKNFDYITEENIPIFLDGLRRSCGTIESEISSINTAIDLLCKLRDILSQSNTIRRVK